MGIVLIYLSLSLIYLCPAPWFDTHGLKFYLGHYGWHLLLSLETRLRKWHNCVWERKTETERQRKREISRLCVWESKEKNLVFKMTWPEKLFQKHQVAMTACSALCVSLCQGGVTQAHVRGRRFGYAAHLVENAVQPFAAHELHHQETVILRRKQPPTGC